MNGSLDLNSSLSEYLWRFHGTPHFPSSSHCFLIILNVNPNIQIHCLRCICVGITTVNLSSLKCACQSLQVMVSQHFYAPATLASSAFPGPDTWVKRTISYCLPKFLPLSLTCLAWESLWSWCFPLAFLPLDLFHFSDAFIQQISVEYLLCFRPISLLSSY